jgi:O-antigen/teichoic acid export membrane protein
MTTISRPIAKSSSALLFSQIALMAFNFGTTIYILRLLSKTEFAVIVVLDILISLFGFTDFGLFAVALQQAPSLLQPGQDAARGLSLVKCAVWYRSLALLAIGLLFSLIASQLSQLFLKTPDYTWAVILMIPAAMGMVWYQSFQVVAQVKNDYYLFARWDVIIGVLRPILSILGYLFYGLPGFLVGTAISIFISTGGLAWSLHDFFINPVRPAPFWSTFRYGLPFYIRGFARFGFIQYDQFVVAALLTPVDLAGYSVVRRLTRFVFLVVESFQSPIMVRMTALRAEPDEIQVRFFSRATRYLTIIVISLATLLASASPWVMRLYGGEKYASEWPLLLVLLSAQIVYTIYMVYGNAVFARLKPLASLAVESTVGGINFILAPLLVILFGKNGIAWGQMAGFTVGILGASHLLRRKAKYEYDWSSLRLIAGPLTLACSIIVIGQVIPFDAWWVVPVLGAVAVGVFSHLVFRRLREDDWQQILTVVPTQLLFIAHKIQQRYQRAKI